jgi:DNA-binding PadR family transcriptional regulator
LKKAPKGHPIYGWEIPKIIEKKFNFKPGRITPYRVLYCLEMDGFVKSKLKERRRIYKITKKGEAELKKAEIFYQEILNKLK